MPSFFSRIRDGLAKTAQHIRERLGDLVEEPSAPAAATPSTTTRTADTLEAVEEALIGADVGLTATERILDAVRADRSGSIRARVAKEIERVLTDVQAPVVTQVKPRVVLIVGVNGSGKTTTVGKLANLHRSEGRSVVICAADTFRAAAIEQVAVWAERAGVDIIRAKPGADPAAVTFDAVVSAKARGRDIVLVDTAGRLHTRANLMAE